MIVQTTRHENAVVAAVSGKLDAVTAPEYGKQMRDLIDGGSTRVVMDFQELEYISSAGLRELLAAAKLLQERGGQFCVVNVHGHAASTFDMCGIGRVLQVRGTVAEGLAGLG